MKKLLLLTIGAALSFGAFAQSAIIKSTKGTPKLAQSSAKFAARTTSIGSTDTFSHINFAVDTPALYYADTVTTVGYAAGTDTFGDHGFAERYDFNGIDSTVKVIGLISVFGGTINPASTKSVVFNVWSVGAEVAAPFSPTTGAASSFWFESGLPNTVLTSKSVPLTGIYLDSNQITMFTTPTGNIGSFFIGYTINYNSASFGGDTIGLYSTKQNERTSAIYFTSGTDSIANNVNVSEYSDNTWHDNATDNFAFAYNYFLFPIAVIEGPSAVKGITRNNFTFYGNYPNPATDNTNIMFSLANNTDVTITITDMAGRTVNTIKKTDLAAGMQIIPVATANMAEGDYIYLVRTAEGNGMAGKMTVIK